MVDLAAQLKSQQPKHNEDGSEPLLFVEREEVFRCIDRLEEEASLSRLRQILDKYQECSVLLDASLEEMITRLCEYRETSSLFGEKALSALYSLSKVRGRKKIVRFFPHAVADVHDIWQRLCNASSSETSWESSYILWLWMANLSRVPFDTSVLFSDDECFEERLFSLAVSNFNSPGLLREAAAFCLASWLSRPDWEPHMPRFVACGRFMLQSSDASGLFRVLAILQTMVTIIKKQPQLISHFQNLSITITSLENCIEDSALLQKYLIKWWTRSSCAILPPPRCSRHASSHRIPCGLSNQANSTATANDDSVMDCQTQTYDGLYLVPDQVEENVGNLLNLISHAATPVRWSAAKGIGRISERLPGICTLDILDAIRDLLAEDDPEDNVWHGACLTFAELARRGSILPERLPEIVPYIVRALQREIPSRHSAGAGVRDAACYTYWAFARSYRPADLKRFLPELNEAVLTLSLFDREVNCRRAASAAFQEAVGRQGATNVPHGLDILTVADYFTLGNRSNAYLVVANEIAKLDSSHRRSLMRHLYTRKIYHWDPDIRTLASKALNHMALLDSEYIHETILPTLLEKCLHKDVATRHGAILAVAEIIDCQSSSPQECDLLISSAEILEKLVNIVSEIDRRRLYRGRGGELVRGGVCKLVRSISKAKLPLSVKDQVRFLDTVEANITHPSEEICICACQSIGSLLTTYFPVGQRGPSERLQSRVVDKFVKVASTSDNPAATRGYSLALGHLPAKLLAPTTGTLTGILNCLKVVAHPTSTVGREGDAETRRNSLVAIGQIADKVGFENPPSIQPLVCLNAALIADILETYIVSLSDYNTDRRGDVGSWCRIEAMRCATRILIKLAYSRAITISAEKTSAIVCGAIRQIAEKLDSVRRHCANCLEELLLHPEVSISRREAILNAPCRSGSNMRWAEAIQPYTEISKLVSIPEYTECVIHGLASSIGGKGESQSKTAWRAFLYRIRCQDKSTIESSAQCLLKLLEQKQHRLFIPTLVTLDRLLSHRCLNNVIIETDFAANCEPLLESAARNTTHIARIMAIIDVIVSLVAVAFETKHTDIGHRLLLQLCSLLVHPIPRIRTYTAETFYLLLLDLGCTDIADTILHTSWLTAGSDLAESIAAALSVHAVAQEIVAKKQLLSSNSDSSV